MSPVLFLPELIILILTYVSAVLIEGVLFRARYLGSTQLTCDGRPTKSSRMAQAQEAVARVKVSLQGDTLRLTRLFKFRHRRVKSNQAQKLIYLFQRKRLWY